MLLIIICKYIKGDKNYQSYNNEKEILSDLYINLVYFMITKKKFSMIFEKDFELFCIVKGLSII